MKVQRGSRKPYPFFNLGPRWECAVKDTLRPLHPLEIDQIPIVLEDGWDPGSVWKGAENLVSPGIRSPDRATRSESLYRLRYPGRQFYFHAEYFVLSHQYFPKYVCSAQYGCFM
jgi:hypothetical protein